MFAGFRRIEQVLPSNGPPDDPRIVISNDILVLVLW